MAKSQKVKVQPKPRVLKKPEYKHFRLQKRIKHPKSKLTGGLRLFWRSLKVLASRPRLLGGILVVYALLTIVFVKGFSGTTNLAELRQNIEQLFAGQINQIGVGLVLMSFVVGSVSNPTTETGGAYQGFLAIIVSLALIWALRQVMANKAAKVKQAFYQGMYPLVPFVLVCVVIMLQLIPALIGSTVFDLAINGGLAITAIEKGLWALLFLLLVLLSFYMVSSSVFALYIVALPDMTPLAALRSARQLVLHRRGVILRRLIVLPVSLILLAALIMLPIVLYATPYAEWIFFGLSTLALGIVHTYVYSLYRELLT